MALFFDNIDIGNPQTHVLIIGVGGYRFLSGGEEEKVQSFVQSGILGQLTSPPKSALEFRDSLMKIHALDEIHLQQPLGSIEFLLSPSPEDPNPGRPGEAFEAATIDNIQAAYSSWKTRCNSDVDNVAVFFFSGHGLAKTDHYLLAEDFGENPNNPWLGSFAFDKTRRAFHSCRAKTQCFFVDSCREVTSNMLNFDITVSPLEQSNINVEDCQHDLTIKSSAHNQTAHGPRKKPSYFTQALIKAFKGYAASNKQNNSWPIRTTDISGKIHDILGIVKPGQEHRQQFSGGHGPPIILLRHDVPPMAQLIITCNPEVAIGDATISYKNLIDNRVMIRPAFAPEPWKLEVRSGFYELSAVFNGSPFNNSNDLVFVEPPGTEKTLNC